MSASQADKAERLRALHVPGDPLVLVNAWDVVSARIIEDAGYPAVATTSAGIAWAEGFADGERISRDAMLERVRRIAAGVAVPVTADLEGGYGATDADAAATAQSAIEAGAVGLNFEDATRGSGELLDPDRQVARIAAMREAAQRLHVPLVINARTDVFLASVGPDDAWRRAEATRRANAYLAAGADCAFVPGVADEHTINALVRGIRGPLNILAGAATPPIPRLAQLGVARVSVGSGAMAYMLAKFRDFARTLRTSGGFEALDGRIAHNELNVIVEGKTS